MLTHKTIASGVLSSNTDGGDLDFYKLYTAPTSSGTEVKSVIFHNRSGEYQTVDPPPLNFWPPVRLYVNVSWADELRTDDVAQQDTITVTAGNSTTDTFAVTTNALTTSAVDSVVGNNNSTATNIATAVDNLAGVSAAAVDNVVTITADNAGHGLGGGGYGAGKFGDYGISSVLLTNADGANNQTAVVQTITENQIAELSSENRIMYLNLSDFETVEWDIGYLFHLKEGESIYGETDYPHLINYYINGAEDEGCNKACP